MDIWARVCQKHNSFDETLMAVLVGMSGWCDTCGGVRNCGQSRASGVGVVTESGLIRNLRRRPRVQVVHAISGNRRTK